MAHDLNQERLRIHSLIDQLPPTTLSAVRGLLEVFLDEDRDTLSPAEAQAIAEADEWLKHNKPIQHEEVLAEFGLSAADWEKMSRER
ncbi:MAG: hypothetical protein JNL62_14635 [Bryobacterales bacterium]|nr:hypothetical protein [Bryobacterales bacterium]